MPRHIPNILTTLRFLLVIPVIFALLNEHYLLALYLFIIAGITDGLDGLLARLYGWTSQFGAIADPLADKILLMSSFVVLAWLKQIPTWLVVLIVARDIWIVLGATGYRFLIGQPDFIPTGISKINTFLQIFLVMAVLVHLSLFQLPLWLLNSLIVSVALTSSISLLHYTWAWSLLALKNYRLAKERIQPSETKNNTPKAEQKI